MTDKMRVYALKVDVDWSKDVHASLLEGVGRFGWSYTKDDSGHPIGSADLEQLKAKIETNGWPSLNQDDQARYQAFLLDLKRGDWIVYVNVPEWGRCTIAQVTGPYYWKALGDDFNHCFSVDPKSVHSFDRNADIVHPALRARLKLQGRWWHIYAEHEFRALISNLTAGVVAKPSTAFTDASTLRREIEPLLQEITTRVQWTHPNYGLEALLEIVFNNIPGVRTASFTSSSTTSTPTRKTNIGSRPTPMCNFISRRQARPGSIRSRYGSRSCRGSRSAAPPSQASNSSLESANVKVFGCRPVTEVAANSAA